MQISIIKRTTLKIRMINANFKERRDNRWVESDASNKSCHLPCQTLPLTRKECHEDSNYMIKRCFFVHINKSFYFNLKEIIKN